MSVILFLSTPSARRATRRLRGPFRLFQISIHALREEGDYECFKRRIKPNVFLSTPSARRATSPAIIPLPPEKFLSTPSARRATLYFCAFMGYYHKFLSTPSARRATQLRRRTGHPHSISIHALREEGDPHPVRVAFIVHGFLSTPSARRATPARDHHGLALMLFLSTPSARRATVGPLADVRVDTISIHALREEGDIEVLLRSRLPVYFYPRPPRGGRPAFPP